jgi:hypothetical protein
VPASNGASLTAVAWHKASLKWVAVGNHGAGTAPCVLLSDDGSTWVALAANPFHTFDDFLALVSTGNVLLGGGLDGLGSSATSMKLSNDGSNWRATPNPAGSGKYVVDLAWSGRRAVGVGGNGGATSTYIAASSAL